MENFRPTVLRHKALDVLRGNWKEAAIVGLIYFIILIASEGISFGSRGIGCLIAIFVTSFVGIGFYFVFLDLYTKGKVVNDTLWEAFRDYTRYLVGVLLMFVYVLLWTLLLIVPGIIKGISYSMTYYIMRENPEMTGEQAICRSMEMMRGHKMDFFLLGLSYIGWAILALLTAGIGFIWLTPYIYTAYGAFYEELKKDYELRVQ